MQNLVAGSRIRKKKNKQFFSFIKVWLYFKKKQSMQTFYFQFLQKTDAENIAKYLEN